MKSLFWISAMLLTIAAGCKKSDKMSLASLTTTATSSITSSAAQSGGDITGSGGSNISKRGVCYAMHSGPTVSDSVTIDGSGTGTYTSSLSNLISNATYYARAYAINADGTAYGNELSFVTAKGLATVTTTAVTNIAPLVAHSGGNVLSDGGATVTSRGLCWSTSPHPTVSDSRTSDSSGTGIFIDTLVNLASQATYYVRAYATNSYGTAYGNEISFPSASATTVTDIEGNIYGTVVIGTQTWTTSNLRTAHYRNGDVIVNGLATNFDWYNNFYAYLFVGAFTFSSGDSSNNTVLGKLYNNYVVNDSRGVCPVGWHVPSDLEWQTLELYEGMSPSDTAKEGPRGFGTMVGTKLILGGASGLNLQLAGALVFPDPGQFVYEHFKEPSDGFYWSSTIVGDGYFGNFFRVFNIGSPDPAPVYRSADHEYAESVRCIKN